MTHDNQVASITDIREPVQISLGGPRKGQSIEKVKAAWGIPLAMDDLPSMVHMSRGGWRLLALPSRPEIYTYATKAAAHPDGPWYLYLLAECVLFSQYPLGEAVVIIRDLMGLDPRKDKYPQHWANDWAFAAVNTVNVWEARQADTVALGSLAAVQTFVAETFAATGLAQARAAEMTAEARSARAREHVARVQAALDAEHSAMARYVGEVAS